VLLSTDGLIDLKNKAGERFGIPRVKELVEAKGYGSAAELKGCLLEKIAAFREDTPLPDDMTVVLLGCEGF
jgi:serine phosphatase RsbU (regulator of sigma subunit)